MDFLDIPIAQKDSQVLINLLIHLKQASLANKTHNDSTIDYIGLFELMVSKKHEIQNFESVFNQCMKYCITDINKFFHDSVKSYLLKDDLLTILLNTTIAEINILDARFCMDCSWRGFVLCDSDKYSESIKNITKMPLLHAKLNLANEKSKKDCYSKEIINDSLYNFVNALLNYDKRILLQKDSDGNDVFHYLYHLELTVKQYDIDEEYKNKFDKIYSLIKNE
jgi:hypothetical protein